MGCGRVSGTGAPTSIRSELEAALSELPGLTRRPSRYGDGQSFFVADREIAHFHGDHRLDVRLTRARIRELKTEGELDARVITRGRTADWVEVALSRVEDIAFATLLVEDAIRANA
ncbi:MAG TPA: luciferase family protein [Thermoplasmata archaeon]|nr:luciferase family protein [Thermoplasmata archaeon]